LVSVDADGDAVGTHAVGGGEVVTDTGGPLACGVADPGFILEQAFGGFLEEAGVGANALAEGLKAVAPGGAARVGGFGAELVDGVGDGDVASIAVHVEVRAIGEE